MNVDASFNGLVVPQTSIYGYTNRSSVPFKAQLGGGPDPSQKKKELKKYRSRLENNYDDSDSQDDG